MTMIRKQVFITAEQNRKLKLRAAATGQAEAELIRAALDRELDSIAEEGDWRAALDEFMSSVRPGDFDGLAERVEENRRRDTEIRSQRMAEAQRKLAGK